MRGAAGDNCRRAHQLLTALRSTVATSCRSSTALRRLSIVIAAERSCIAPQQLGGALPLQESC